LNTRFGLRRSGVHQWNSWPADEPLIYLGDARAVDAYRELPSFRFFVGMREVRTFLVASLRKAGTLLDAIGIYR